MSVQKSGNLLKAPGMCAYVDLLVIYLCVYVYL